MAQDALARTHDALAQSKDAKADLVKDEGIGTDLYPALFAWGDQGDGYAILIDSGPDRATEYSRVLAAVIAISRGWGPHTVAFVKEGYAAQKGSEHDPRPLSERFVDDPTVHECITVTTVTKDGDAAFAIQPYTVGLGRVVQWWDEPDIVAMNALDLPVTNALHLALIDDSTPPTTPEIALDVLDELGFAGVWCVPPTPPV